MATPIPLLEQLEELLAALAERGIAHAAIGGLALGAHGYPRATRDLDLLIRQSDADAAREAVEALGFQPIHCQADLSSFARGAERVDFIHAGRADSLALLERAQHFDIGPGLPVVSVEGLIALKLQAFHNDPRRLQDLADIQELMRVNRDRLNLAELRRLNSSNVRTCWMTSSTESPLDQAIRESARATGDRALNAVERHDREAVLALSPRQRILLVAELSDAMRALDEGSRTHEPLRADDFRL